MATKNSNTKRPQRRGSNHRRNETTGVKPEVPKTINSSVYEALKNDASNIYFNNLLGTKLLDTSPIPGILTMEIAPNFTSRSDMINVAATSIYTYVRHANSGRSNYESSDYMAYLIAMGEVYVALTDLVRAYGISSFFASRNLYSGLLLQSLGYNAEEFRANLGDIRYSINALINKVKAFAVPRAFNYFEERISEVSSIYKDGESDFSQYIVKVFSSMGTFDATSEGGSAIKFYDVDKKNFATYIAHLNKVVDDLRMNEDINIMSGDTLKAYGDDLFSLVPVEPGFALEPSYDPLFLAQLQNAHVADNYEVGDLLQSGNRLTHSVNAMDGATDSIAHVSSLDKTRILNSNSETIDGNLIFALSKYQITTDEYGELVSGNTSLLHRSKLWTIQGSEINDPQIHGFSQVLTTLDQWEEVSAITKFKNHPYVYLKSETYPKALPMGDMHMVAELAPEDTNRMNDARFILAFQTKQMG